ncbi:MAG: DUF3995 domain-containing protein [Actinomycetota bacterium]|nr:DUF3995 domain-containing protein [Actinomycetota bacterium]
MAAGKRSVTHRVAVAAAWAAFVLGAGYAAVSAYWGLGGTALLDTLGGALEREARSGSAGSLILVWSTAVLKLCAAVLPVAVIRGAGYLSGRPWPRTLAWIEGAVLTVYGLVLTVVGLLVQVGILTPSRHSDHRALAWHAFLWDPWFLCWGVLVAIAMFASREPESPQFRGEALV